MTEVFQHPHKVEKFQEIDFPRFTIPFIGNKVEQITRFNKMKA